MQDISILDAVIFQMLKPGAVKRNIRILLYIPIQLDPVFLQLLAQRGAEFILDPGKGLIQAGTLHRTLVNAQVETPDSVELNF